MALFTKIYSLISRLYQYDSVKRIKSAFRPFKHILFGREGIYAVVERAKALSGQRGREIANVFDIGAAVGDTAESFLKEFPLAEIYCFEPLPDSFSRLQKRVGKHGKVHLFNLGLSNASGEAKFYVVPYRDSSSMIPPVNIGVSAEKEISVPVRRLDDVVCELGVSHIDFMKVDVEGAEKEMLEGAKESLKITDHVFIEISPLRKGKHSRDYIDVFGYLHDSGFSLAGIYSDFFFTKLL